VKGKALGTNKLARLDVKETGSSNPIDVHFTLDESPGLAATTKPGSALSEPSERSQFIPYHRATAAS